MFEDDSLTEKVEDPAKDTAGIDLDNADKEKKNEAITIGTPIILDILSIVSGIFGAVVPNKTVQFSFFGLAVVFFIIMLVVRFGKRKPRMIGTLKKVLEWICLVFTFFFLIITFGQISGIKSLQELDLATFIIEVFCGPEVDRTIRTPSEKIAAGNDFSMLLRSDKTVVTYGPATGINTSDWANITQIAAYKDHAIGLREDGSVVVTGAQMDEYDISDWSNIQQVAACKNGVIGVTPNGEVEFEGPCHNCMIACDDWSRVQKIIGAAEIIVAQKMDNTLIAVNEQKDLKKLSMDSGRSIVSGTAVKDRILLVLDNGRIKLIGDGSDLEKTVAKWVDIKQVAAGIGFAVGLKLNGTAIPTGAPVDNTLDVSGWQNVAAICAGKEHVLGLCEDGTVLTAGNVSNGLGEIANENYWVN